MKRYTAAHYAAIYAEHAATHGRLAIEGLKWNNDSDYAAAQWAYHRARTAASWALRIPYAGAMSEATDRRVWTD